MKDGPPMLSSAASTATTTINSTKVNPLFRRRNALDLCEALIIWDSGLPTESATASL